MLKRISVELLARPAQALPILMSTLFLAVTPAAAADLPLDLNEYRGKVVVVDFWASWCVPCRRSFPWLIEMQEKYGPDGLLVVAINMDENDADAETFLRDYPVNFRIVRDPDGVLARQYDVVAMPSSYVINRDGDIATRHLGFKVAREQQYEEVLVQLLQENTASSTH